MTVCFKMHSLSYWLIIILWITMFNKILLSRFSISIPCKYQQASNTKKFGLKS